MCFRVRSCDGKTLKQQKLQAANKGSFLECQNKKRVTIPRSQTYFKSIAGFEGIRLASRRSDQNMLGKYPCVLLAGCSLLLSCRRLYFATVASIVLGVYKLGVVCTVVLE